jgi:hypothetical protein
MQASRNLPGDSLLDPIESPLAHGLTDTTERAASRPGFATDCPA